jgi:DNA-directed RNA polymerase subunit RPC12/RpoP
VDFEIACTCGQNMLVESQYVGQDVQCPGCGGVLVVPPVPRSGDPVPVVWPRSQTVPPRPPPVVLPPFDVGYGPVSPSLRRTNGKAIAAFVCGVLGVFLFPCSFILSLVGILLANQAKLEIRMRPDLYNGIGLARAGQVLGIVGLTLFIGGCVMAGCLHLFR